MNEGNEGIYRLLREMIRKGLASTGNGWIEKAAQQKNPRLAVGIASSVTLTYDPIDRKLIVLNKNN
jgi:hypothetical protein